MDSILVTKQLSKSFKKGQFALNDCSFSLKRGSICAVVGESGSGKTTLLRLIAGLERPTAGAIEIDGKTVSDDHKIVPPQQRNIGLVFQNYALFPHLTVAENIAFGIKKKEDRQPIVDKMLDLVQLSEYKNVYPSTLSGGQAQRIALARTLALDPQLLLLDEPFSNLDTLLKTMLRQEVKRIVRSSGISMLFVTHDLMDAIDIADEIVLLVDGDLVTHCSVDEFTRLNKSTGQAGMLMEDMRSNARRILGEG